MKTFGLLSNYILLLSTRSSYCRGGSGGEAAVALFPPGRRYVEFVSPREQDCLGAGVVGLKMLLGGIYEVAVGWSLAIVALLIAGSTGPRVEGSRDC